MAAFCWLFWLLLAGSGIAHGVAQRGLLSEEDMNGWLDSHMRDEQSDASVQSLGRMLLAFQALNTLTDKKSLGLKDKPSLDLKSKEFLSGLKEKKSLTGKKDKLGGLLDNPAEQVFGVAAGVGSLPEASVNALSNYLNTLIKREQDLLAQYSKGTVDDQFSYLIDLPENDLQNRILPMFGVVNSGVLVNTTQALKEAFCSPMASLPRRYTGRRAIINGPSFELTLSTGKCEVSAGVADDNIPFTFVKEKKIMCTGHDASFTKLPMSISRRDIIPEAFASEECKVERDIGTPYEKVSMTSMGSCF